MARYIYKFRKFLLNKVLHAHDTPHAIALGMGIAVLVAFLPLVGFQTAIAVGLATLLRANKAVCIPVVWITNPATLWFIYGGCWKLGQWVASSPSPAPEDTSAILTKLEGATEAVPFYEFAFWKERFDLLVGLEELWIGCTIVGLFFGLASYLTTYRGVIAYRERRRRRILRRNLFRAQLKQDGASHRGEPA